MTVDLDKGGRGFRTVRAYRGPTLGWTEVEVKPEVFVITTPYTIQPEDGIILLQLAGIQTVNLPQCSEWFNSISRYLDHSLELAIWIKDYGGNATAFNKTIHPFAGDTIDGLAQDFTIVQNRQLLRLYPLNTLTGWISG
jgi:hypothetical protein